MPSPILILTLLLTILFTLSTWFEAQGLASKNRRSRDTDVMTVLFGDARRLFANHFFTKADVYFHSGYYPSIFDQAAAKPSTEHLGGGQEEDAAAEHEREMNFLGKPRDWIERFGRNFMITRHTELEESADVREILPWLRLSSDIDPNRVETYTVGAFWLRHHIGKPAEAEKFLREGLRANPASYEILFELGRLYDENYADRSRARNVWQLALRYWTKQQADLSDPDLVSYREILAHLGRLEKAEGNLQKAIAYLEQLKPASPNPDEIQKQIEQLKAANAPDHKPKQ